jgi:acyl transferase domain-containing protein
MLLDVITSSVEYPRGVSSASQLFSSFTDGVEFQETIPLERFDPELCGGGARTATFVADVAMFDASVFRVSDAEAVAMDPQQRKLLDMVLRNYASAPSGTMESALGSKTGVYLGVMWTEYQHLLVALAAPQNAYTGTGNGLSFLVGRPSFVFGLVGPSTVLDTACSSSLVATHLASQAVSNAEASSAHAAGVQCMLLSDTFSVLNNLNALSPDGRCKTLDANADGYGRGEGYAALYMTPATADGGAAVLGDAARLRVLGAAVNQDGRSSTFTAPYGPSQQALMQQALREASTAPGEVRFLSAHGTGTSLGDPIELAAAGRALSAANDFSGAEGGALTVIGASKSYLGHTEGTAGLSGLLMAAAAAGQRAAPSLRHCRNLNPHVAASLGALAAGQLVGDGSVVFTAPRTSSSAIAIDRVDIDAGAVVVASTSSFGMSGVNSHAVIGVVRGGGAHSRAASHRDHSQGRHDLSQRDVRRGACVHVGPRRQRRRAVSRRGVHGGSARGASR